MRYIQRKTKVRKHGRTTKHSETTVRNHERNLKGRPVLGTIKLKNLNYPQAKMVFPALEPYGDADEDGVMNKKDCHPFDVDRQDDYDDIIDNEFNKEHDQIINRYNLGRFAQSTPELDQEKKEKLDKDLEELEEKRKIALNERMKEMDEKRERDELWEKANKGKLTQKDLDEHELNSFRRDV